MWITRQNWVSLNSKLDKILSLLATQGKNDMATKADLDKLAADVTANTSAVASATQALMAYASSNATLTAQLQAALANDDSAAVEAAASALEANNAALTAAVPAVAAAVVANTPAAGAG